MNQQWLPLKQRLLWTTMHHSLGLILPPMVDPQLYPGFQHLLEQDQLPVEMTPTLNPPGKELQDSVGCVALEVT